MTPLLFVLLAAAPDITVSDAVLRLPPGGTGSGALYLTIENRSDKPDVLLKATTKAARHTMLHETVQDGDVAKMVHADKWPVPAKGKLVLAPRGKHVMLMGMKGTKVGQTVEVVLEFERSKPVVVKVRAAGFTD